MSIELIFSVVTAVVTAILGALSKDKVIPSRFIPLQNLVIGVISGIIAVCFKLFDNVGIAIFTCLAMALCAGGAYDLYAIPSKTKAEQIPETDAHINEFDTDEEDD